MKVKFWRCIMPKAVALKAVAHCKIHVGVKAKLNMALFALRGQL
jgi:hypothetical protein